ncbi:telomere-associated protein Tap [Kitasatospora sp. NPDC059795]|uniref:telomere-associated protein Tap n=1 Tax=Kitasatospora sp. NPDC059795 TaxID=3346949 RepID=UPI0036630F92
MTAPAPAGRDAFSGDRSSYERLLNALDVMGCAPSPRGSDHIDARCPAPGHADQSASFSADWRPPTGDRAGRMLMKCHTGCDYNDLLAGLGFVSRDLYDGRSPGFQARPATSVPRPASPRTAETAPHDGKATGPGATKKQAPDHKHDFREEARHVYTDSDAVVLATIVRKRCAKDCREKTFATHYPHRKKPAGAGRLVDWLGLYNLPRVVSAIKTGEKVYVVEGEGDADRLALLGVAATCNPAGAGKWQPQHTEQLAGAHVVVVADYDPAGYRHAHHVADELHGTAASVTVVRGVPTAPKSDVSDHLDAGHNLDALIPVPAEDLAAGKPGAAEQAAEKAAKAKKALDGAPGLPVPGSPGWRYDAAPDGGSVWKAGRKDEQPWILMLDWAPYVTERLVVVGDDGKSAGRHYTVTVGEDTLTLPIAELRTTEGWDKFGDDSGNSSRTTREVLVNIVTAQGRSLPRTMVVTRTGWHQLPDGRTFVYPDGRTYPPNRPVRVLDVREDKRRAAAPLDGPPCSDKEVAEAVRLIAAHGWAGLMGLSVGARSLGFTLRQVPAAFLIQAEPNSGKTGVLNIGRSLVFTSRPTLWPPVVTRPMSSTVTDIECEVDLEGDLPSLLDDVALTRASGPAIVRDYLVKFEALIRAAGNNGEIKGRRNRNMTARPAYRNRSIPAIAAQMLPTDLQESLYRRAVVVYISREGGEYDWRWYKTTGGTKLARPLRAIGDRIIALLHGKGDAADTYLAALEAKALELFAPHVDRHVSAAPGTMEGVVSAAAQMLAGLGLVAEASGLTMEDLVAVVAGPLAQSLARQSREMDDQNVLQDDLATAVADVLHQAFATHKAHVRDASGAVRPAVPGEVEQAQGLARKGEDGHGMPVWEGRGPALYWLPAAPGSGVPVMGVRGRHLLTLLQASSDPRVKGFSERTLPQRLLAAGVSVPNTAEQARVATHRIRIGTDNPRLILLDATRLWDIGDDTPPPADGPERPEGDTGPSGPDGSDDPAQGSGPQPAASDESPTTPELPQGEPGLFDSAEAAGTAPEATPGTEPGTDEEDEEVPTYLEQQAPCVECGRPTPRREDDGTPRHLNVPGLFSCRATQAGGGFLAPAPAPAGPSPLPASQVPARQPAPAAGAATTPRPTPAAPDRPGADRTASADGQHGEAPAAEHPNGPLAVLETAEDGTLTAYLADGRTLVCEAKSINTLATWALGAGLGQARLHKWGTDADPMLVLTASAAAKLGLPQELEDRRQLRLPEDHKVVKALTKAGWQLTKRGFSAWTRLYKPVKDNVRQCVQLAVMPWDALGGTNGWAIETGTAPADVARILGTYANRVIAPRGSMGTNGIELLMQLRPQTRPVKDLDENEEWTGKWVPGPVHGSFTRAVQPAPPEAPEEHPLAQGRDEEKDAMREEAWNWHRDLTAQEAALFTAAVGLDTNTSFLSGSSRLLVGDGDPVHHQRPAFDKKKPGSWHADFSHVDWDPRFPCPLTPDGLPPTGPGWYATQTMAYAIHELGHQVEPLEGWLRRPAAAAWLDPWQEHLATAYKDTMARLGITPGMDPAEFLAAMEAYNRGAGDPVERQVLRYIKQTVKSGIGKLRQSPGRHWGHKTGDPWPELEKVWWRPDVRAAVIATTRVAQHRKMLKTFKLTGLAPLAAYSDCVIYPATAPDALAVVPRTADGAQVPGAFRLGVQPGWCKQEGVRDLAWYTDMHAKGINPARYVAPRASERDTEGE